MFLRPTDLAAVLLTYLDEAGLHGDPTATIVGGLIGRVEDWLQLEPRWRQRVAADHISAFHATKCRGGHGEYHSWRPDWPRMERHYRDLAKIAGDFGLRPVSGTVLRADWDALDEPRLKARFESPYVFCFELCLFHIETLARQLGDQAFVIYSVNQQHAARAGELAAAYVRDMRFFPAFGVVSLASQLRRPPSRRPIWRPSRCTTCSTRRTLRSGRRSTC